jgi:hypothetical protein
MRVVFMLMVLLLSFQVYPQDIKVRSIKRVIPEGNGSYLLSGVVPGTGLLLVAGGGYDGLSLLDPRNGKVKPVTDDAGAGYEPAVTPDGKKIYYRSDTFTDNMKRSSVYSYDIESGGRDLLLEKKRDVLPPAVSGDAVLIKSEDELKVERGQNTLKSVREETFVLIEDMMPVIYRGAERKALMPNGDGFYIWASLSPDGTMILYNYQGRGTYICDTDGKILYDLGRINAPRWFNDRLVIGMDDRDDGHRITSSELVYYSLTAGKRVTLTSTPGRSEMFPYPSGNRQIAFCTDKGEIYIMKVRIR